MADRRCPRCDGSLTYGVSTHTVTVCCRYCPCRSFEARGEPEPWPPGTWITSDTGFTRIGPDGKSDAHVARLDENTWGISTHWAPSLVWVRASEFSDFHFADEVLAAA